MHLELRAREAEQGVSWEGWDELLSASRDLLVAWANRGVTFTYRLDARLEDDVAVIGVDHLEPDGQAEFRRSWLWARGALVFMLADLAERLMIDEDGRLLADQEGIRAVPLTVTVTPVVCDVWTSDDQAEIRGLTARVLTASSRAIRGRDRRVRKDATMMLLALADRWEAAGGRGLTCRLRKSHGFHLSLVDLHDVAISVEHSAKEMELSFSVQEMATLLLHARRGILADPELRAAPAVHVALGPDWDLQLTAG